MNAYQHALLLIPHAACIAHKLVGQPILARFTYDAGSSLDDETLAVQLPFTIGAPPSMQHRHFAG